MTAATTSSPPATLAVAPGLVIAAGPPAASATGSGTTTMATSTPSSSASTAAPTPATTIPTSTAVEKPRKRRRRAPTTGATEDCFTCRRRQVRCDRKRPYCTPCIDSGNDCAGYRTTLTWGVGIASRGKLRGLSCPVTQLPQSSSEGTPSSATPSTATPSTATPSSAGAGSPPNSVPPPPTKSPPKTNLRPKQAVRPSYESSESPEKQHAELRRDSSQRPSRSPQVQHPAASTFAPLPFTSPPPQLTTTFNSIPTSNPATTSSHISPTGPTSAPTSAPAFSDYGPPPLQAVFHGPTSAGTHSPLPPHSSPLEHQYQQFQAQPNWAMPNFTPQTQERHSRATPRARRRHPMHHQHQHQALDPLQTSMAPMFHESMTPTSMPMSAFSDRSWNSPVDMAHSPYDQPLTGQFQHLHTQTFLESNPSNSSNNSLAYSDASLVPASAGGLSSSLSSEPGSFYDSPPTGELSMGEQPTYLDLGEQGSVTSMSNMTPNLYQSLSNESSLDEEYDEEVKRDGSQSMTVATAPQPFSGMPQFYQLNPRVQFLLDFYAKNICSVLVAFDGPNNPYRTNVLHLAMVNEGLQNAVAALALNNMRMRGSREARRLLDYSGQPDHPRSAPTLDLSDSANLAILTSEPRPQRDTNPTTEEMFYRRRAIDLLNMQLANPSESRSDAVLATLTVLCMFHVCDSGFSKFKTQFAGVQRLLRLRESALQSSFIGWVEMFFTWVDVMTSTVNDRETEIRPDSVDMLDLNANMGSLEHLVGCDGQLFKLIARLGRLNLLSQGRPVRQEERAESTPRASPPPWARTSGRTGSTSSTGSAMQAEYWPAPPDPVTSFVTEEGWTSPGSATSDHTATPRRLPSTSHVDGPTPFPDDRVEFWREWQEIRHRLETWSMDAMQVPDPSARSNAPTSPSHATGSGPTPAQTELLHISYAFRAAALLYTERLTCPSIPASSPNLQHFVQQALSHISAIPLDSCVNKFLLWPLFMVGTECVSLDDRQVVRVRCIGIQKESGFFNNLSGLEVLERCWQDDDNGIRSQSTDGVTIPDPMSAFFPSPQIPQQADQPQSSQSQLAQSFDMFSTMGHAGSIMSAFRWRRGMDRAGGEYIMI